MAVYLVARIEIEDRDAYGEYERGFLDVFQQFDGELLAVEEAPVMLEGEHGCTRSVLLRFPDEAAARAWYESPGYQALAGKRWASSKGSLAILRGLG